MTSRLITICDDCWNKYFKDSWEFTISPILLGECDKCNKNLDEEKTSHTIDKKTFDRLMDNLI